MNEQRWYQPAGSESVMIGSGCGGDWRRAAACCALSSCQAGPMMTDDAQLEGCGTARSSTLSVSAAAGALRARVEPAGQSGVDG